MQQTGRTLFTCQRLPHACFIISCFLSALFVNTRCAIGWVVLKLWVFIQNISHPAGCTKEWKSMYFPQTCMVYVLYNPAPLVWQVNVSIMLFGGVNGERGTSIGYTMRMRGYRIYTTEGEARGRVYSMTPNPNCITGLYQSAEAFSFPIGSSRTVQCN